MIRIERDPSFWAAVADDLVGVMPGLSSAYVGAMCQAESVLPLASEHGGFLFVKRDPGGFVCELHTLYHSCAWATREVTIAAKQAFNAIFLAEYQVVTTLEVRANPMSQPPRSYGFVQCGDWRPSAAGEVRMWVLTRAAFEASAVSKRLRAQLN